MKYLILRRSGEDPFTRPVAAQEAGDGFEFPYTVESAEMEHAEASDVRSQPGVADVITSIPLSLITPVDADDTEPADGSPGAPATPWGIDAVAADDTPFDGHGVTVAVLDTGITPAHEAFKGLSLAKQNLRDFIADPRGKPGSATDWHGHGTHVAGTLFGRPVNGTRIGVAPGIERVLIGKVIGPKGGPTESVLNAIQWALAERADIISMSLGIDYPGLVETLIGDGLPPKIAGSRALEAYRSNIRLFDRLAALIDAHARGALVVAASGNESRRKQNPKFTVAVAPPAAANGFISVGAVGKTKDPTKPFEVASFSNTGCLLVGPGADILSADWKGSLVVKSGTSMATPHVAGVAALWIQKLFPDPSDRPLDWTKDVRRNLESSVVSLPGLARADVGLGLAQAPRKT